MIDDIIEVNLTLKLPKNYWLAFVEAVKQFPRVDDDGITDCDTPETFLVDVIKENVRQVTEGNTFEGADYIAVKYGIER